MSKEVVGRILVKYALPAMAWVATACGYSPDISQNQLLSPEGLIKLTVNH